MAMLLVTLFSYQNFGGILPLNIVIPSITGKWSGITVKCIKIFEDELLLPCNSYSNILKSINHMHIGTVQLCESEIMQQNTDIIITC